MNAKSHRPTHPLVGTFEKFVHSEVAGSVVLLLCTVAALIWANSPWRETYDDLLHAKLGISWDGKLLLPLTLHHWINDALMVVFFFVVGLEVKRELVVGHLSTWKKAVLPISAAAGGLVAPAAVFALFNMSGPGARGWGVPMATDIAFALGILAVFGKRVPIGLKVFVTAAAIADDIGAVLVIALFYTETISVAALGVAAVLLVAMYVVTRVLRIRRLGIVLPLIIGVWVAVFASGVHATVAGILVALLIPVRGEIHPEKFLELAETRLQLLRSSSLTTESMVHDEQQMDAIVDLHQAARELEPAGLALEHYLHPVQSFVILPLFALANAGVDLSGDVLGALLSPVALGIVAGLFIGKQIGIVAFSWAIVRSGQAAMPDRVSWGQLYGASCLAGVGFTMSLFISELAFGDPALIAQAKIGILAASLLSGLWGAAVLHRTLPEAD